MRQTTLLAAAILVAAPAISEAATMQAVFTGVGASKGTQYSGYRDDGGDVRNETVWDETYAGTPGKITIVYDTALSEIQSNAVDHPGGNRSEDLRLERAITSIEVTSGDEVLFSKAHSGGIHSDGWGGDFISDHRNFGPGSGENEQFSVHSQTHSSLTGDDERTDGTYDIYADFSLYSLFSLFDLEAPLSATAGEEYAGSLSFVQDDTTGFYDGDTELGYQRVYTAYSWQTKSLTVTRLDDTPQPAPVPLPAGAPLVLTGLAGLIGLRRLKRRA